MLTWTRLLPAALLLAGAPLAAQATPDEEALARALVALVFESPPRNGFQSVMVRTGTTPFDSAVSGRLRERFPEWAADRDTLPSIWTQGAEIDGDSAAVLWLTRSAPGESGTISVVTYRMVFARQPAGWRWIRQEYVDGATLGPPREGGG